MNDKTTWYMIIMIVMMLVVPGGIVGVGAVDGPDLETGTVPIMTGDVVSTSEGITVEKVDASSLEYVLDRVQLPEITGELRMRTNVDNDFVVQDTDSRLLESFSEWGLKPSRDYTDPTVAYATRASDDEPNDDFANGSKVASAETVTGSLEFPATDPTGDLGDYIDWYKMEITGVDPTVPGLSKNVTFNLKSFTGDGTTLYEFTWDSTGQLTTDYVDFMRVYVFHDAPFWGTSMLGGHLFYYDDADDTDGWIYDGGHSDPRFTDNWTFNFESASDDSRGVEDTNGLIGGLTEDGWYYIGISFDYYLTATAEDRPDFNINYQFEVSTANDINNFPLTPTTQAGAPNDFNNATATRPTMPGRTDSGLNFFDWYRFDGVNDDYIWNMSVWVNSSRFSIGGDPANGQFVADDNWMWVYLMWWGPGEDNKYSTADDIWTVTFKVLFYMIYYTDTAGNQVSWMQERVTTGGANNMQLHLWNINNRTDATAGHPYLNGDARQMFIGLYSEPTKFMQFTTGWGQVYPDYQVMDQYTIEWSVHEVKPNDAPVIESVTVTTEQPTGVEINDPTGGYLETEYTIDVEYSDINGDLPQSISLIFDEKESKAIELKDLEIDLMDGDVTDGKHFATTLTGEILGEIPSTHSIKVYANDIPSNPLLKSMRSNVFYLNDTLRVWDDEPVELNPFAETLYIYLEDSDPSAIYMDGAEGLFKDPESDFRGCNVYNFTTEKWEYDYDTELLHVNVSKSEGFWQAKIILAEDQYDPEGITVRFRGYDDHSEKNISVKIKVDEVNDPPMVTALNIKGTDHEVDNFNPLSPLIHLEDSVTVKEDETFEFKIIAEDTDLEEDRVALEYSFEQSLSDPWEEVPDVNYNDGTVTMVPTNNDVKKGNSKLTFTIDDRGTDGDIKLTVYLELTNVNDAPSITIPTTTLRTWTQFQRIAIKPIGSDEDKSDVLTYDVNFEQSKEVVSGTGSTTYDSILDQLPFAEVDKGIDWDINPSTGEFWFKIDDQKIWEESDGMVKSKEIVLVFEAKDKAGATATALITLVLNDQNEEPNAPTQIYASPTTQQEGKVVEFSVDNVTDPDGDDVRYKWEFGDGATGEGRVVSHVYTKRSFYTVYVWVEDDQFQTEKLSLRYEVTEAPIVDDDDDTQTDDDIGTQGDDNTMLYVIIGIIALFLLLLIIIVAVVLLRRKPAPAAQQYPGYYDPALAAYAAQGLPGGYPGGLPPVEAPGLPPAQGEVPPMDALQQPLVAVAPPTPQPEMATQAPPQQQPPAGNACPSCGSPVDASWFLCPNCKAPLQ